MSDENINSVESAEPIINTPAEPEAVGTKPVWGDDWRQNIAKELGYSDDEKFLKRLERFTTPAGAVKSWLSVDQKISSGEYKKALGENATEEEKSAYRKSIGIPDTPDKYDFSLPDGTVFGDDDKAVFKSFAEIAHAQNMSQEQMRSTLGWYKDHVSAQQEAQQEADYNYQKEAEDTLRGEWGGEYRANINALTGLMAKLPEDVRNGLNEARMPDGSKLGNNPAYLRFMVEMAREINPIGTLLPAGSTAGDLQTQKDEYKAMMRDKSSPYYTDGGKTRAKYNELLQVEEKLQRRA